MIYGPFFSGSWSGCGQMVGFTSGLKGFLGLQNYFTVVTLMNSRYGKKLQKK